jgi:hypothetical protein
MDPKDWQIPGMAPASGSHFGVTSSSGGAAKPSPSPSSMAARDACTDVWRTLSWGMNFDLQMVGGIGKGAWDLVCFSTRIPGLIDSVNELGEAVSDWDGYQAKKAAERDAAWNVISGGPGAWWHAATDPIGDAWNTNPGQLIGEAEFTAATFAVPGGALIKGGKVAEETTRVGRWMGDVELAEMQSTGRAVEGGDGRTFVVSPADPAAYPPGKGNYVEFDVPTESLRPAGNPAWKVIPGPNVTTTRFGPPPPQMPPATCIVVVCKR